MTEAAATAANQIGRSADHWDQAKSERNWLVYRLVDREGQKPQKIPQAGSGTIVIPPVAKSLTRKLASTTP